MKFQKPIDHNGQRDINLADPTAGTDAATKQYVDNVAAGLNWKARVRVASTGNVVIASGLVNGTTIDGVAIATGDRVLLKNQSTGAENGIYLVPASGAASRTTDADTSAEVRNMIVGIESGTAGADTIYQLVTDAPTLGTTALVFTQFTGGGATYTAGTGIDLTGNVISVVTGYRGRSFAASCVATTNPQSFAHGFGTADFVWQVPAGGVDTEPDVSVDATNITVDWGGAPTAGQYRVRAVAVV